MPVLKRRFQVQPLIYNVPPQARRSGLRALRPWTRWPDERILDLRFCDLELRLDNTWLRYGVEQLWEELEQKGIRAKPHCWLSNEWFCPDGVPGFAIPFYLAHPRLMQLEQSIMRNVEGGSYSWLMRILRHEAGHAIQNAYRLHRRARWQELFGRATLPYPPFYQPRPASRNHVLHLDFWYAQSHPVEDFAETFATWLAPRSGWRKRYARWPALKKLIYVDELMAEVGPQPPPVRRRTQVDSIATLTETLREHYRKKRATYGTVGETSVYDADLRALFGHMLDQPGYESASAFLTRNRRVIREEVTKWTKEYDFALDHVLREMIGRCHRLRLSRITSERKALHDFTLLLTARTVQYLHTSRERYAL